MFCFLNFHNYHWKKPEFWLMSYYKLYCNTLLILCDIIVVAVVCMYNYSYYTCWNPLVLTTCIYMHVFVTLPDYIWIIICYFQCLLKSFSVVYEMARLSTTYIHMYLLPIITFNVFLKLIFFSVCVSNGTMLLLFLFLN